ncbi:MAG: cytochrome c3 family protein [Desulfurivibrionaceae bacterium]
MRTKKVLALSAALACLMAGAAVSQANKFNLKTGAREETCLTCHTDFKEKIEKEFIHSPLAAGDCTGCHNPHTSSHGKLMAAETDRICYQCHDNLVPEEAESVHQVVLEGNCLQCHDPHAADNRANLIRAGSRLCFECHEGLARDIDENEFSHSPVQDDCLSCHDPHASADNRSLLTNNDPALCLDCHQTGSSFQERHKDYPVEDGRCTSCHNPHGSNTPPILYDNVHDPVNRGMCSQCHVEASAGDPFALKSTGMKVCQGCHYDTMNDMLSRKRLHWPVVGEKGCINCHSPHASPEGRLLKEAPLKLCGQCHTDTLARQERAQTEHPPVAEGECSTCHSPHSSDHIFLLEQGSTIDLCGDCHDWQTHSTHPIGEEVIDPRNQNLTLQCLSCHRTHGTEYEKFLYYETTKDLCVQCHEKYRR